MFKLRNVLIMVLGLFLITGCFKSEEEKYQDKINKILNHMETKYGEKFYVSSPFGGRGRNDDLRVMVKPLRYKGTSKEDDDFYEDYAFIKTNSITGDGFGTVYLKEGAEEYFKPKLKELFGENVLVAIEPEGKYKYIDFKQEMNDRSREYNSNPIGSYPPLSGGIYIFGRVESEADREYYRKQIYEFIQYLKAENMFDYVDIVVTIYDERSLVNSYSKVLSLLKEAKSTEKNSDDYKKKRSKILEPLTDDFKVLKEIEIQKKLENIIKSNMLGKNGWTNEYSYSQIYHKAIRSPKFIQTNSFPSIREYKVINYNKIEELKLLDSIKIDYKEYDDKALKRGEWGD